DGRRGTRRQDARAGERSRETAVAQILDVERALPVARGDLDGGSRGRRQGELDGPEGDLGGVPRARGGRVERDVQRRGQTLPRRVDHAAEHRLDVGRLEAGAGNDLGERLGPRDAAVWSLAG